MAEFVGDRAACTPNHKTGNWITGGLHLFCAAVGAGVLGLPWAVAQLGWVAGPILLATFYLVSRWAAVLQAELYCVDGLEHARYHHAVRHILGRPGAMAAGVFQTANLLLLCLAYLIIGSESMSFIAEQLGSPFYRQYQMSLVFGALEVVLSQLPNLEHVWWVSLVGSAMSLLYCTIALILGCTYADAGLGSVQGTTGLSPAGKAFACLNALGSLGFAYGVSNVLMEVTDTLRQPPSAVQQMRRSINVALTVAAAFYISVACTGYASLGDATPSLVLSGFTGAPQWAVLTAHYAIVVHMVSAWQVFAQPIFDLIESQVKAWRIRRQLRRAHAKAGTAPAQCQPAASVASNGGCSGVSPKPSSVPAPLEVVAEEGSQQEASSHFGELPDGPLGRRHLSSRSFHGGPVTYNSAPLPDLLPPKRWAHQETFFRRTLMAEARATDALPTAGTAPIHRSGSSFLSLLEHSRAGMYRQCPGLANEHVPLNESGFLLPLPLRLLMRTLCVLALTALAVVMPFVLPATGLVGSICWYPLTVGFPFLCWAKVYRPTGARLVLMWLVGLAMLLVALAATVGSVYSLVNSLQSVEWFQ